MDMYLPGFNGWSDDDLLKRREQLPYFRSMVLNGSKITDQGLALLKDCRKIRELHLIGTHVSNKGLDCVSELTSLDWLVVEEGFVTDSGIRKLSSLSNLKSLQLVNTMVSEDGLTVIEHYPELTYLEAVSYHLGGSAVATIAAQPSLHSVRITSGAIEDDDFMEFASARSLRSLNYSFPRVSRRAGEELKEKMPHCLIQASGHVTEEAKFALKPLLSEAFAFYEEGRYTWTVNVLNDAAQVNPYHPSLNGLKAFAHFKMGSFEGFRASMAAVLEEAASVGNKHLTDFARYYLSLDNFTELTLIVARENPVLYLKSLIDSGYKPEKAVPKSNLILNPFYGHGACFGSGQLIMPSAIQMPKKPSGATRLSEYIAEINKMQADGAFNDYIKQPRPELILLERMRRHYENDLPWSW